MLMLSVGCFVATASIWGEAGGAQWPCLLLSILTVPTPGWLGVPAMADPGDRGCPVVPSAGLAGAQAGTSSVQIDQEAF